MDDHADLARQAFDASALPDPPRTVEQALAYLNRLLSMVPPEERAGYVTAPAGGENSAFLPDGTTFVRVARVCYPNGQLYKVMNDVPNGGPQWVDNGLVPSGQRYVPFAAGGPPPPPPPPKPVDVAAILAPIQAQLRNLDARLSDLDARTAALQSVFTEMSKQIGMINQQIADLSTKSTPAAALPDYIGRLGPVTIISRPRT